MNPKSLDALKLVNMRERDWDRGSESYVWKVLPTNEQIHAPTHRPTAHIWRVCMCECVCVCVCVSEWEREREKKERERGRKRAWACGSFLTLPHNRFTLPSESLFHLKRLVSLQWTIATAQQGAEESHYLKLPFVKTTVTKKKQREQQQRI